MAYVQEQKRAPKSWRSEKESRIIASGAGGALLGGTLFSVPGAIVGGIIGAYLGHLRNQELKGEKPGGRA